LAISRSLPTAIGIVLCTSPVLAVVLLLVTTRPRRVSTLFLAGWSAGILTVAGVVVGFVDTSVRRGLPPTAAALARIALGVILALFAVRAWRRRRSDRSPPKMLAKVASWSGRRAFTVSFALGAVNPKTFALTVSGATAILGASALAFEQAVAVLVFAAVASVGVATPIVLHAVGGPSVTRQLERAARWVRANGKLLSAGVLALLAVMLLSAGVRRLCAPSG
jgi:hypothetical protein